MVCRSGVVFVVAVLEEGAAVATNQQATCQAPNNNTKNELQGIILYL